jgi:tRNA(fMet)-specific endonuclease VapC
MKSYLLDTNVLVSLIRSESFTAKFEENYKSPKNDLYISVVVQGELESLAIQWNWSNTRLARMEETIAKFAILPIKVRSIIEAYARIDAYSQGKLPGKPLPAGLTSRNMGKNDLWIAATAHSINATLLTTDPDFGHLGRQFLTLDQIDIGRFT